MDRLAVAAQPDGELALHRVLVERELALRAPRAPHRQPRVRRDPALGVDADHLHLGRAHQLAGHLALGDHHRVGGHRGALVDGVRLGDDAVRDDVADRVGRGDGDEVVDLERLAVEDPHLERLAARGLVAEDDPDAAHAATAAVLGLGDADRRDRQRVEPGARGRPPHRPQRQAAVAHAVAQPPLQRRDRGEVLGRARVAVGAPGEVGQLGGGPVGEPGRLGDARRARDLAAQDARPAAGRRRPGGAGTTTGGPRRSRRAGCAARRRGATTHAASSGPRYMRWWLLMAPTTGPSASRRNDSRPSSTTRRSGGGQLLGQRRARAPGGTRPRGGPGRSPRGPPPRAAPSGTRPWAAGPGGRSPTVSTWRRTATPSMPRRRARRGEHRPGGDRERRAGQRGGLAGGRHREPRLHLLGAVHERQLAGRRGPRVDGSPLTILDPGVDRGGLGVLGVESRSVRGIRDQDGGLRARVRPSADCSPTPGRARRARQPLSSLRPARPPADRRAGRRGDAA